VRHIKDHAKTLFSPLENNSLKKMSNFIPTRAVLRHEDQASSAFLYGSSKRI